MTELNFPNQDTYTRKELAKRWGWKKSEIDAYIGMGQLKESLPPDAMRKLDEQDFYRCEKQEPLSGNYRTIEAEMGSSNVWLLEMIEDGKMLEEYVGKIKQEKIIACPKHLYKPIEDNAIEKRAYKDYNIIRYFYDLHGNALIPIRYKANQHQVCFAPVKKEHLDSLIVPLEEVRRFEREGNIKTEQNRKDTETSSKANDEISYRQPPTTDDVFLTIKQVSDCIGFKPITIRKKIKAGDFPEGIKIGSSVRWRASVVDAWKKKMEKMSKRKKNENLIDKKIPDKESNE